MPLHVPPPSRRSFLRGALSSGVGGLLLGCSGQRDVTRNAPLLSLENPGHEACERWTLLSDPHIPADLGETRRGTHMAGQFNRAMDGILSARHRPDGVLVNGDCAYLHGMSGDYSSFADVCVKPFTNAGTPVHLLMGNHDHRARFRNALHDAAPAVGLVDGRCTSIVEGAHARWFMLDSLEKTGSMNGRIGDEQLRWLDASLARLNDRPALIMGHHPIAFGSPVPFLFGALKDGGRLWRVLRRHAHVKAYFYGHTHRWQAAKREGIYLVNLPTTAYVFDGRQPRGWVDATVHARGADLRLHQVAKFKKKKADRVALTWA